jgi:hypothetical protein
MTMAYHPLIGWSFTTETVARPLIRSSIIAAFASRFFSFFIKWYRPIRCYNAGAIHLHGMDCVWLGLIAVTEHLRPCLASASRSAPMVPETLPATHSTKDTATALRRSRIGGKLFIPYTIWVAFAGLLNFDLYRLNSL